ncbi:major capsid protein [Dipodfec virus UOA04_Rod_535]|nr:major capsid protein [Dipodfec virus UOA04_Rod_535]
MSKVFGKNNGRPNRVKRNTVDLSFQNNGSYQFGGLYPVMCKEVLPGDSFDFDITAAFRFMPMVFPVQTRMRVDFHAFYVRNRNLWKDWPDFIGGTKDNLYPPTVSPSVSSKWKTGDLADYLGLPTTYVTGQSSSVSSIPIRSYFRVNQTSGELSTVVPFVGMNVGPTTFPITVYPTTLSAGSTNVVLAYGDFGPTTFTGVSSISYDFTLPVLAVASTSSIEYNLIVALLNPAGDILDLSFTSPTFPGPSNVLELSASGTFVTSPDESYRVVVFYQRTAVSSTTNASYPTGVSTSPAFLSFDGFIGFGSDIVDYSSLSSIRNPYASVPPSALPFRAYESIYNSFYRDDRNNPLFIKGEPEYNKYLTNYDGGVDTKEYNLHYRNWEQDMFTTALPTPQQGNAPLVGISSTGVATFVDSETGKQYNIQAVTADDADTVTNFTVKENIPNSVARSLVNYATSGISINDFRNVNAYQRWLETNIRRGLKYRDQIKSHFDVDVSFEELDMPEFIGGTSIPVNVGTVNQTSESSVSSDGSWNSPLGSYAGQAFAVGSSKNRITKYFDEHGYLMVIMSVVPVPNYSQSVDKHWFKQDKLDYYFPEFGHIGLQSIPQKLLSIVQTANQGASSDVLKNLEKTFGYQRPWYEYLESRDEIHGLMRTQLNNFVLNRVFSSEPSLSPDFLTINPEQLNNIFSVTDITDKIVGQVYFDIKAKRPIPMYGVPRLESNL